MMKRGGKELSEIFAGRSVLVAGGLGFIGSNLARRLAELGAEVALVDSLAPDYGGNSFNIRGIEPRVQVTIGDVRDDRLITELVAGRDLVFNLVGQVSHTDSMEDPYTDLEINVRSQISILEACRKKNPGVKIVYSSTRQVYGRPCYLPVDEKHPVQPTDVNGINKLSAELYHALYGRVYGMRTVSLRLTNTYGPRQLMKHSRQGFIAWFIRQVVEGSEIQLYGDGSQLRDFNYVDDVVEAMLLAAADEDSNDEFYNLGGDPISLRALVEMMIEINGGGSYRLVPFPPEKKRIDIGDYHADYSKVRRRLGWTPRTPLGEGLRKTIEFYKENLGWYIK